MAPSRRSPTREDDDPFVRLLEWVITGYGHEELLHTIDQRKKLDGESVDRRTLDNWRAGEYPRQKRSSKVEFLDKLAQDLKDYPPPRGQGKSLVDLSGPSATPSTRSHDSSTTSATATTSSTSAGKTRSWNHWPALVTVAIVAFVSGGLLTYALKDPGDGQNPGDPPDASTSASPEPTLPSRPGLVVEIAAGRGDKEVPVYASPQGDAVPANVTARIPYGTPLYVKCRTPNQTGGMRSVAGFYLIVGGTWDGLYAVSNGFTNGDPLGTQGGHNLDPTIPMCPPRT